MEAVKYYGVLGIGLILFIIIIICVAGSKGKTPLTNEQFRVKAALIGYEAIDNSEKAREEYYNIAGSSFIEDKDIYLQFYEVTYQETLDRIYSDAVQLIHQKRTHRTTTEHYKNYMMCAASSDDTHYIVIMVGNTVAFGHCDTENKAELYKILKAIEYQ